MSSTQLESTGRTVDSGVVVSTLIWSVNGNEIPEVGNFERANDGFLHLRTGTPVRRRGLPSRLEGTHVGSYRRRSAQKAAHIFHTEDFNAFSCDLNAVTAAKIPEQSHPFQEPTGLEAV